MPRQTNWIVEDIDAGEEDSHPSLPPLEDAGSGGDVERTGAGRLGPFATFSNTVHGVTVRGVDRNHVDLSDFVFSVRATTVGGFSGGRLRDDGGNNEGNSGRSTPSSLPSLVTPPRYADDSTDDEMPSLVSRRRILSSSSDESDRSSSIPPLVPRRRYSSSSSDEDGLPPLIRRGRDDSSTGSGGSTPPRPLAARRRPWHDSDSSDDDEALPRRLGGMMRIRSFRLWDNDNSSEENDDWPRSFFSMRITRRSRLWAGLFDPPYGNRRRRRRIGERVFDVPELVQPAEEKKTLPSPDQVLRQSLQDMKSRRLKEEEAWDELRRVIAQTGDDGLLQELEQCRDKTVEELRTMLRAEGVDYAMEDDAIALAKLYVTRSFTLVQSQQGEPAEPAMKLRGELLHYFQHFEADPRAEEWMWEELKGRESMSPDELAAELRERGMDPSSYPNKLSLLHACMMALLESKTKPLEEQWQEELELLAEEDVSERASKLNLAEPRRLRTSNGPKSGCWVLAPSLSKRGWMDLTYAYYDGAAIRRTPTCGRFQEGSALLQGAPPGRIWVHCPSDKDAWDVLQCTEQGLCVNMLYSARKGAKLQVDGGDGMWVLESTKWSEGVACLRYLCSKEENRAHALVPTQTLLIKDRSKGIWLLVPEQEDFDQTFSVSLALSRCLLPGLWYYSMDAGPSHVMSGFHRDFCFSRQNNQEGILMLMPAIKEGVSLLVRVHKDGTQQRQELKVDFCSVLRIMDDGRAGAFVVYDCADQLKIGGARFGSSQVDWLGHTYPTDCKISTDGMGAVWILSKSARNEAGQSLQYCLNSDVRIEERETYPTGSILG